MGFGKRILVTGSSGFIGGYIYRRLLENKAEEDIIVGISRQSEECYEPGKTSSLYNSKLDGSGWARRLLLDLKPDVIFHFAGCATVSSPPDQIWSSNVDTTFNLLQYAPKNCRFILASSINASNVNTVYASSKRTAETLVEAYSRQDLVNGVSVRLCAVAGAYNTHGVVKAVVDKWMKDDEVKLLTDSCKPFTYVCDVVDKVLNLIDPNPIWTSSGEVLDLCPSGNISVTEIANITKKLTGIDKKFSFSDTSWNGDSDYVVHLRSYASEKIFGDLPSSKIAVETAIRDILRFEYGVKI